MAVFEIDSELFETIEAELTAVSHAQERITASDEPSSADVSRITTNVIDSGYFSPSALKDERERRVAEIVVRRGQPEFRRKLVAAYDCSCAITGYAAVAALEAAHIVAYTGPQSDHVTNGLLLRADIHTLFDLDLIGIHPEKRTITLAPVLKDTEYAELKGRKLADPINPKDAPNRDALVERWKEFCNDGR